MTFETFIPERRNTERGQATVTVAPIGRPNSGVALRLTVSAIALLGKPQRVTLLFDPDARRIGIAAATEDEIKAGISYILNRGNKSVGSVAFCARYGLDAYTGIPIPAHMEGDILVAPLPITETEATA